MIDIKRAMLKTTKRSALIFMVTLLLLFSAIAVFTIRYTGSSHTPLIESITREQAIPKAQEYLLRDIDNMDPSLRLMLDYLYRKFGMDATFSARTTEIFAKSDDALVQHELKALLRFAYKDSLVTELGPNPTFVARAANCDHIPIPNNMNSLLQQEIDKGGYDLTHAFLSLRLMKELDCQMSNRDALLERSLAGLKTIAADEKTLLDLRFECIAFLMYAGRFDITEPDWIDNVYETQHQNGGWSLDTVDKNTNDHTTVLALWALLEYESPDRPYEPIIHKPNQRTD